MDQQRTGWSRGCPPPASSAVAAGKTTAPWPQSYPVRPAHPPIRRSGCLRPRTSSKGNNRPCTAAGQRNRGIPGRSRRPGSRHPSGRVGHEDADVATVEPARFVGQPQSLREDPGHGLEGVLPVLGASDAQRQERQRLLPAIGPGALALQGRAKAVCRIKTVAFVLFAGPLEKLAEPHKGFFQSSLRLFKIAPTILAPA